MNYFEKIYNFFNNLIVKCRLLFLLLLFLFYSTETLLCKYHIKLFYINNEINESNGISKMNNLTHLIEEEKNNESNFEENILCIPTEKDILWEKQTNLEIENLVNIIKNKQLINISFENKDYFYKRNNPKISLIITIFNQGYYLETLYSFILQQELKDIEIIFVDDASSDNSSLIIKELMKLDKRIILIKNKVNKKQFYSIYIGILNSLGEYILSIDPDDLLLNNILIKAYKTAKYYNLDIVQFYMIFENTIWKKVKYKSGIICGNQNIRNIFYYGKTRNLPDKLIRRVIFLKSIKFMKKEFYNKDYHIHTDDTIFFGIIHFARSYGFLEQIGYFYNQDPNRNKNKNSKMHSLVVDNQDLKSLFNIMKYFIIQSDNNKIEKINIPYQFYSKKVKKYINSSIRNMTTDFDFYIEVLNLYINHNYINIDNFY